MICRRFFVVSASALLAGCAVLQQPGAGLPALPASGRGAYRLGSGDTVTVRIYDQPQLSGDFAVDDSGYIDVPLIGLVGATGLTTAQLTDAIGARLRVKNLILAPNVTAEISRFRPFYILGEVNAPGQYPYRPGMTVLTAISIAGGFTYRAVQGYVGVTRDVGSKAVQYRADTFAMAAPGDVITVFERRF
jgi:polysaccharide export outer membrane protein